LKPSLAFSTHNARNRPQSNQRGIETPEKSFFRLFDMEGLNRTSVGLKRGQGNKAAPRPAEPQSNQRGIETILRRHRDGSGPQASIEPAWD